jgi:hypothetical protein
MPLSLRQKASDLRDTAYGLPGPVTDRPDHRLEFQDFVMQTTVVQLRGANCLSCVKMQGLH